MFAGIVVMGRSDQGRVMRRRTKRLPFVPVGRVALICWVVPVSLKMELVTPEALQGAARVSLHSTVQVMSVAALFLK